MLCRHRFVLTQIAEREFRLEVQVRARWAKANAIVHQLRRNPIIFGGSLDGRDPRRNTPDTVLTALICHDAIFKLTTSNTTPHAEALDNRLVDPYFESLENISLNGVKMDRYVIERAIPEIGSFEREQLRGAAAQSNGVLSAMQSEGKHIQWEHSYVAGDKTFCIYVADDRALIDEHAERSGFPATVVTEIGKIIDPTTANN